MGSNRRIQRPNDYEAQKIQLHDRVSKRIRERLTSKGMTLAALCDATWQSDSTMSAIINGVTVPSLFQVSLCAKALGCSVAELCE